LCIASLEVQIFQCIVWKKQIYIPKIARYFQHYIFGVCAFQLSLTIGLSAFARSFQFSCDGFSEATNVKETHAPCSFSFLILQFSLSHMHGPRIRFESTRLDIISNIYFSVIRSRVNPSVLTRRIFMSPQYKKTNKNYFLKRYCKLEIFLKYL